jgi:hypothetical protein
MLRKTLAAQINPHKNDDILELWNRLHLVTTIKMEKGRLAMVALSMVLEFSRFQYHKVFPNVKTGLPVSREIGS